LVSDDDKGGGLKMYNKKTVYRSGMGKCVFSVVIIVFMAFAFAVGVYAEEVVFNVMFQGMEIPGEHLVALIFTTQYQFCGALEEGDELRGELEPGDYIVWIYIKEEMQYMYGDGDSDDLSRQPGQKIMDLSVREGGKTVENVVFPTALEFMESSDMGLVWQLSFGMLGSMWGEMFSDGFKVDTWDYDDYYGDDDDYDYYDGYDDYGYYDSEEDWEWSFEFSANTNVQITSDKRPDLRPYGPE
jgi:hypothetical protein